MNNQEFEVGDVELKKFWDQYNHFYKSKKEELGAVKAHKYSLEKMGISSGKGFVDANNMFQRANNLYSPKITSGDFAKYKEEIMKLLNL